MAAGALALAAIVAGLTGCRSDGGSERYDPALEADVLMATIAELESRLAADPRNPVVGSRLIRDHLAAFGLDNELHHLERAETIAERLLPTTLDPSGANAALAAARLARHDFAGALEAADRSVVADSTDAAGLGTLFDAAAAAGEYEWAERVLRSLVLHHPGALGTRLREARWLEALGDAEEAVTRLAPACDRLEGRAVRRQIVAWCDVVLGGIARSSNRPEAATALFLSALETQPGFMPAIEALAEDAYAEGRWNDAWRLYVEIESDAHPDLQLRLAEIARATGDEAGAVGREREFERLTATPEQRALQAHELAIFLARDAATADAALDVMRRDLESRRSMEAFEAMAWVRWRRGELEEGLAASDASLGWGDPSPTSQYVRARILEDLGRLAEARMLDTRATADPGALDPHAFWDYQDRRARGP